jgi:hypothetical protein
MNIDAKSLTTTDYKTVEEYLGDLKDIEEKLKKIQLQLKQRMKFIRMVFILKFKGYLKKQLFKVT